LSTKKNLCGLLVRGEGRQLSIGKKKRARRVDYLRLREEEFWISGSKEKGIIDSGHKGRSKGRTTPMSISRKSGGARSLEPEKSSRKKKTLSFKKGKCQYGKTPAGGVHGMGKGVVKVENVSTRGEKRHQSGTSIQDWTLTAAL